MHLGFKQELAATQQQQRVSVERPAGPPFGPGALGVRQPGAWPLPGVALAPDSALTRPSVRPGGAQSAGRQASCTARYGPGRGDPAEERPTLQGALSQVGELETPSARARRASRCPGAGVPESLAYGGHFPERGIGEAGCLPRGPWGGLRFPGGTFPLQRNQPFLSLPVV